MQFPVSMELSLQLTRHPSRFECDGSVLAAVCQVATGSSDFAEADPATSAAHAFQIAYDAGLAKLTGKRAYRSMADW